MIEYALSTPSVVKAQQQAESYWFSAGLIYPRSAELYLAGNAVSAADTVDTAEKMILIQNNTDIIFFIIVFIQYLLKGTPRNGESLKNQLCVNCKICAEKMLEEISELGEEAYLCGKSNGILNGFAVFVLQYVAVSIYDTNGNGLFAFNG